MLDILNRKMEDRSKLRASTRSQELVPYDMSKDEVSELNTQP